VRPACVDDTGFGELQQGVRGNSDDLASFERASDAGLPAARAAALGSGARQVAAGWPLIIALAGRKSSGICLALGRAETVLPSGPYLLS
jgi:hypothetical protein